MPLPALLSAVTLFGGHVVNRRLDRILLIFALLALLGIVYAVMPSLLFNSPRIHLVSGAISLSALLLIVIAVVSAALTWKDARAPAPPPLSLGSRLAGTVVSLFGLVIMGFATMILLSSLPKSVSSNMAERSSPVVTRSYTIQAFSHLGGNVQWGELRQPPTGPHPLRGRITMAGLPAAFADVEVVLNGAFRSETLTTNAQGVFEILLPAGPWTVNQVSVRHWPDAPENSDLLLFSEYEPLKNTSYYSRTLHVDLPAPADFKLPSFELRNAIAMQWPAASSGAPSESSEAPVADPSTAAIRWSTVPSAREYEIQLSSVERDPQSMSTSTILLRRQSGTELRLADLPKQPRERPEPTEYSVLVYAFDANGKLLSHSREGFALYAFRLDGETRLAQEPLRSSPSRLDDSEHWRNRERLSLVSSLLEYNQLDAARAILREVTDNAPPGRKAAMQGAIEALTGNCAAAIPLLDQADKDGGLGCAPEKYRAMCASMR